MRILVVFSILSCFGCSELEGRAKANSFGDEVEVEDVVVTAAAAVVSPPSFVAPTPPVKVLQIPKKDRTRETAVLIARIAINENTRPLRPLGVNKGTAGEPTSDHKAILHEMVEFSRWKDVSLKRAATWQSKYVTGVKEAKEGHQHAWTSTLPSRGKARPSGWIECPRPKPKDFKCHGSWEIYADNWATFRDWMISEVTGGEILRECPGRPITWGGDMDDSIAIARGLCVIEGCGDRNTFWTFPGWGCEEPLKVALKRKRVKKGSIPARLIIKGWREGARRRPVTQ